jgi:hypothetical protein
MHSPQINGNAPDLSPEEQAALQKMDDSHPQTLKRYLDVRPSWVITACHALTLTVPQAHTATTASDQIVWCMLTTGLMHACICGISSQRRSVQACLHTAHPVPFSFILAMCP